MKRKLFTNRFLTVKTKEENNTEILLTGFDDRLGRRAELIELIDKLTTEKEQIEQDLKAFMGEAELASSDKFIVSWKAVITNRIDTKLLKEELPQIYKIYQKENCSRRLMIKAI